MVPSHMELTVALFIIRESGRPDRRFDLPRKEIVIGREEGCDLILPNVSVSRRHAVIKPSGFELKIENLSSSSSLMINGQDVKEKTLMTGDELSIGKFGLVYFGDQLSPVEQLHDGRMLNEFPDYRVREAGPSDSTFQLSAGQAKHLREALRRQRSAVVLRKDDEEERWTPGDQPLGFGKKESIPVKGWLGGGSVAVIEWTGSGHQIRKKGLLKVRVNGKLVELRQLMDGDEFSVGTSVFIYRLEG